MKRLIVSLALTLALVLAPYTVEVTFGQSARPVLPWKTFSEMSHYAVGAHQTMCGFAALIMSGSASYILAVNENGTRIVVYYDPVPQDRDARPTFYAVAVVDKKNNDRIPPLNWLPVSDSTPDPCTLLRLTANYTPQEA